MQNRLRPILGLTLATTSLLLAGCAPSLVGKWKGNMAGSNPAGIKAEGTMEFKSDGNFVQSVNAPPFGSVVASGTYKAEGENLDLNVKDIQAGGKSVMALVPAQAKEKLNQKATFKIHDDKLDLTISGKPTTLDKVKE